MTIKLQDPETLEVVQLLVDSLDQASKAAKRLQLILIIPEGE